METTQKLDLVVVESNEEHQVFDLNAETFDEDALRAELRRIGPEYTDDTVEACVRICHQEWLRVKNGGKAPTMAERSRAIRDAIANALKEKAPAGKMPQGRHHRRAGKAAERKQRFDAVLSVERTNNRERRELAAAIKKGKLRLKK